MKKSQAFAEILALKGIQPVQKIIDIFKGEDNDFSIAVCLNAAAGLIVSGNKNNFKESYHESRDHILSGKTLDHLKKITPNT